MKRALTMLAPLLLAGAGAPAAFAQGRGSTPAPSPTPSPNLQVLQGLSPIQLQRTMNTVRASLGVHCDFCHVVTEEGGWQWARDDKETKRTARRMMRMVMDINRGQFEGRPVVGCNTCHRGAQRPSSTPALPQAPPPFPTPVADRAGYPTVKEILDHYVSAAGGEAAANRMARAKTVRIKGTRQTWDGVGVPFELLQAGDRFRITLDAAGGQVVQTFDRAAGRVRDAKGTRDMKPDQLENALALAAGFQAFAPADVAPGAMVEGKERIGDRDAWQVVAQLDGHTRSRFFFDAQTGLLLRRTVERDGPIGRIPEQLDLSDYRSNQGAVLPFVQRLSLVDPWVGSTRRLETIEVDVPVEEAVFRQD